MCLQKNASPLHILAADETAEPLLVIEELFDFASLEDIRELLWSWLKTSVAGTYHTELSPEERSALLSLYEKMEKLVEAAWVLRARAKEER